MCFCLFQVSIVPHLVRLITLVLVKMVPIVRLAHPYRIHLNAALGFTAPEEVPYLSLVLQDYSPIPQEETAVTLVLKVSTASLWSLPEMNPLDTVSAQGDSTVLRELVLIGDHVQLALTVIALVCMMKSSAKTAMLESSVMEGT